MIRIVIVALLLAVAAPAAGYIDLVQAPAAAETGEPVLLWIEGGMADTCWQFLDFDVEYDGTLAVVDLWTAYDNGGGGCFTIIVPYECFPELVFDRPGTWTVRILEHRIHPQFVLPDLVHEETVEVTGAVPAEGVPWGAVKARYR